MRLTAILLTVACIHASASGYTQSITLNEKNAPLQKIFKEVNRQTGYQFFYKDELLDKAGRVDVVVKNVSIEQVLAICFKNLDISYTITDKVIVIARREERPTKQTPQSMNDLQLPPPIDIHGRVVDENGKPVIASVQVKGTNKGTTTNDNGEFELKGVDDNATLVISGVSIESFEVKVNGRSELALNAKVKNVQGEEVIVEINTGYQRLPKERATGAFTKVDNETINFRPGSNIINRLEGLTTGLQFDNHVSGETKLRVRGLFTLNESTAKPLIVLDNFPYDGDINNLNPNDIESITILKDAAAASIWGARAGNGVIVITTKKGQYNQPLSIGVNTNLSVAKKTDLFNLPIISPSDEIELEKFLFSKNFSFSDTLSALKPPFTPVYEILFRQRRGIITQQDANQQIENLKQYDVRNDFMKYSYQNPVTQRHALNLNGGSSSSKYYFSIGYDKNLPELKGNESNRITTTLDNSFQLFKTVKINTSFNYSINDNKLNSLGDYSAYNLGNRPLYAYARFADENGNPIAWDYKYRGGFTDTAGRGKLLDWKYRPLDELQNKDVSAKSNALLAKANVVIPIITPLTVEGSFQYQKNNGVLRDYKSIATFYSRDLINYFTQISGNTITNSVPKGGILDLTSQDMNSYAARTQLNFNSTLLKKGQISAVTGAEIREVKFQSNKYRTYGYNEKLNVGTVNFAARQPIYFGPTQFIDPGVDFASTSDRFVSLYANAAYTYDNRFIVSGSFRKDASNLLGVETNNKWKPLWSTGLSWNISKEKFYHLNFLPILRVRSTYGYNGNVNNTVSALLLISTQSAAGNPVPNLPYAFVSASPNRNLRWEEVRTFNFGMDFGIKGNRINGSVDYYNKKSNDVIAGRTLDPTTGVDFILSNSANIAGNGVELALNSINIKRGNFSWMSNFNFNHSTYKVTKVMRDNPLRDKGYVSNANIIDGGSPLTGLSPYTIISYKFQGLDPTNGDPLGFLNGKVSKNYDSIINYSPLSNQVIHGSAVPTFFGNLLNTFSFRDLSVSANIVYNLNYYFRKNSISYTAMYSNYGYMTNIDYMKRWQQPGDELKTVVPSQVYPAISQRDQFYLNSSINVKRGDHIVFDEVRVAYSFNKWINKTNLFKGLALYGNVSNLNIILWKSTEDLDPRYWSGLIPSKAFTIGLNATL